MVSLTPGRCTFTATAVPSGNVARYTWPMLAAASGSWSKVVNSSSTVPPSSASMRSRICSHGSVGTSSWSFASSTARSGVTRSRRVARICPILMNAGPSLSRAWRTRTAGGRSFSLPAGSGAGSTASVGRCSSSPLPLKAVRTRSSHRTLAISR